MFKLFNAQENEEGSVVVLSLLVLVILSIVGFSASRTSTTEKQIIRNDAIYQENFYLAESGATEAAQMLHDTVDNSGLRDRTLTWLNRKQDLDFDNIDTWFTSSGANQTANISSITDDNSVKFSVADAGVSAGWDKDPTKSAMHNFSIIGISNQGERGQITIEVGYRRIVPGL
jgi:hypothetical protein